MSYDAEKLAALTDKDLASLDANVKRLAVSGSPGQKVEAERLAPMIEAERASRAPAPKTPAARKTAAKKSKKAAPV